MSRSRSPREIILAAQRLREDTRIVLDKCWDLIFVARLKYAGEASRLAFSAFTDLSDHWPMAAILRLYERFVLLRSCATEAFSESDLGSTGVEWKNQYIAREVIGDASWFTHALCNIELRFAQVCESSDSDLSWEPGGDGERCCIEAHMVLAFLVQLFEIPHLLAIPEEVLENGILGEVREGFRRSFEEIDGFPKELIARYRGHHSRAKGLSVEGVVSAALSFFGEVFASELAAVWDIFFVTSYFSGERRVIAIQVKAGSPFLSPNTLEEMRRLVESNGLEARGKNILFGVLIVLRDEQPRPGELSFDIWTVKQLCEIQGSKLSGFAVPPRNEADTEEGVLRISFDCKFGAHVKSLRPLLKALQA